MEVGDAILAINGEAVSSKGEVVRRLASGSVGPGSTTELSVRRGLPHPYAPHPRLDLFAAAVSPHPASEFGCTVCHEGQGSATEFKFASHTPNDLRQRSRWRAEHGWFWNHDWHLPMRPARFAESACLKCHHNVSELEPSDRFPDPPAPKLVEGYHLVRQNGCFGCHEIRGWSDEGERIGPDMRLEPSAAASIEKPRQGTMRKVGPNLREVGVRLDAAFIEAFVRMPSDFRPESRMPHFYGMQKHLGGKGLDEAKRFEPVEVRAVAGYLLSQSRPAPLIAAPAGVTELPLAERSKNLFQTQGCLACHRHAHFPAAVSRQGADLSRIGSQWNGPSAVKWLTSWLRDPSHHSPRTLMPQIPIEPICVSAAEEGGGAVKQSELRLTDPVADIAAYLGQPAAERPGLISKSSPRHSCRNGTWTR